MRAAPRPTRSARRSGRRRRGSALLARERDRVHGRLGQVAAAVEHEAGRGQPARGSESTARRRGTTRRSRRRGGSCAGAARRARRRRARPPARAGRAAAAGCGSGRRSRPARRTAARTSSARSPPRSMAAPACTRAAPAESPLEQPVLDAGAPQRPQLKLERALLAAASGGSGCGRRGRGGRPSQAAAISGTRWSRTTASTASGRYGREQPRPRASRYCRSSCSPSASRAAERRREVVVDQSGREPARERKRLVRPGRRDGHERRAGRQRLELRDPVVLPARRVHEQPRTAAPSPAIRACETRPPTRRRAARARRAGRASAGPRRARSRRSRAAAGRRGGPRGAQDVEPALAAGSRRTRRRRCRARRRRRAAPRPAPARSGAARRPGPLRRRRRSTAAARARLGERAARRGRCQAPAAPRAVERGRRVEADGVWAGRSRWSSAAVTAEKTVNPAAAPRARAAPRRASTRSVTAGWRRSRPAAPICDLAQLAGQPARTQLSRECLVRAPQPGGRAERDERDVHGLGHHGEVNLRPGVSRASRVGRGADEEPRRLPRGRASIAPVAGHRRAVRGDRRGRRLDATRPRTWRGGRARA